MELDSALFPGGDGETHCPKIRSNNPFKLAVGPSSGWARWLPSARLDEHRLLMIPRDIWSFLLKAGWSNAATCDGCRVLSLRSPQAMARRSVRRSVRTRSRTEQVCGAKQRQDHAVSPIAKQEATIWLRSFWRARWASKGSCL